MIIIIIIMIVLYIYIPNDCLGHRMLNVKSKCLIVGA